MKQENNGGGVVVTFILILLIIAVFAGLIYVSYRIVNLDTTPENVATNEVLEENVENKIENKVEVVQNTVQELAESALRVAPCSELPENPEPLVFYVVDVAEEDGNE